MLAFRFRFQVLPVWLGFPVKIQDYISDLDFGDLDFRLRSQGFDFRFGFQVGDQVSIRLGGTELLRLGEPGRAGAGGTRLGKPQYQSPFGY